MRELEAIISAYDLARAKQQACTLATVVHVEGSSYRRAGARMLIDEYGRMTGAISGGCLEGDALRKALHALEQNRNKLVTYDTSDEDDAVIGAQLGCNGIIQVLFEPIAPDNPLNPLELLRNAVTSKKNTTVVSCFNLQKTKEQPGTILLLNEKTEISALNKADFLPFLREDAKQTLVDGVSSFIEYRANDDRFNAFLQFITPPPHLVTVGAGNDAQVLSQMADLLGWSITVVDGRPTHATADRFIGSCQVLVSKPEQVLNGIVINEQTVFVLMTHNYQYDLSVLKLLLDQPQVPYIGILGPKKKYLRMLDDLGLEGIRLTSAQEQVIYAPVGLELGSETPAEIALSIVSEIQAVLTQSGAGHLRERSGAIHDKNNNEFKVVQI